MTRALSLCFGLAAATACTAQEAVKPVFEPQSIDDAIQIGYGLAAGDVDGDGKTDLLLADKTDIVWYQAPNWKKHVMASHLTLMDNVCIAARDIDGDGKVEVAVGAQWNPSETTDEAKSGAVFYLVRPADPTQRWEPVKLTHEPTVHRMKWVRINEKDWQLVVAPLHGRGNDPKTGDGVPAKILAYTPPADVKDAAAWKTQVVDETLHKTHNFDVRKSKTGAENIVLGGMEGLRKLSFVDGKWIGATIPDPGFAKGVGEVRAMSTQVIATIQPMHGNTVAFYHADVSQDMVGWTRTELDATLSQGHALVCADLLGRGFPAVVAGWREPDPDGKVGIKLYLRAEDGSENWTTTAIDTNKMACEDLLAVDLNGDDRLDLVASGRATHNVIIYWNKSSFDPPGTPRVAKDLPPLTAEEKQAIEARKAKRREPAPPPAEEAK